MRDFFSLLSASSWDLSLFLMARMSSSLKIILCVFQNKGPNLRRRPLQRLVSSGKMILARKKLRKKFLKSKSIAKSSEEFSILNKPFWDGAKRRRILWKSKSMVVPFLIRWTLLVNISRKKFQSRALLPRMKWSTSLVSPREKASKVIIHLVFDGICFKKFVIIYFHGFFCLDFS